MMQTQLLIDIGNSRIKWWFVSPLTPLLLNTQPHAMAHEGVVPEGLKLLWQAHNTPVAVVKISSVVNHALCLAIQALCEALWAQEGLPFEIKVAQVQAQTATLRLNYDARRMGVDRYLQLQAATRLFSNDDCLVIGAGTALTLDGVLRGGRHVGGAIVAGLRLQRAALHQYTAHLPLHGGEDCVAHAPNQTEDALATGARLACAGAIRLFIDRYLAGNSRVRLVFCGGDAQELVGLFEAKWAGEVVHVPALTLMGLAY